MTQDFGWIHLVPLLNGAWLTIQLCFFSLLIGGAIGIIVGLGAASKNKLANFLSSLYIRLVRGVPLLMIIFLIYFALPMLHIGINFSKGFSAVMALSIYAGAYLGEIVRGGIQSVPKGQFEAADALGMTTLQKFRHVIIPQAMKFIIPPGIGFFIALIKDSSLVSIIGYIDLTKAGKVVSSLTFNPIASFLAVAAVYFVLCFGLSKASYYYEKRFLRST
ncbi:amino acid ABC transporter permease [Brevibacillus reuszeri]|uniref:Amino acid ABC transporter permease n=1 Tax=Brevibacillus reuszeri TaxID=54915 RepID=A0A0K9YL57_9BACL|nr:amino acid ABC transporter permease [Brevibacillus reuszeri]KNB69397.1 amino acid ABC transporter permease [Brevibacillus reuszeri]MED1860289.1 amino acid ABC transporter permease [Brevibacillus reuszeri]GED70822.1 amino acid ABC transporter permease [Brevibacillus reuszeri]